MRLKSLLVFVAFLSVSLTAAGQVQPITQVQYNALEKAIDQAEATSEFNKAIRLTETIIAGQKAHQTAIQSNPAFQRRVLKWETRLGMLHQKNDDYALAEQQFRKVAKQYNARTDIPIESRAELASNIGQNYELMGQPVKAEKQYLQGLRIAEGGNSFKALKMQATISNNIGWLYHGLRRKDKEKIKEAKKFIVRASKLRNSIKHLYKNPKTRDTELAESLLNLGTVEFTLGNFADAEGSYLQSLPLYTSALGKENMYSATVQANLAKLYRAMENRQDDALSYAQKSHKTMLKLGHDHPNTAVARHSLCLAQLSKGKLEEAIETMHDARTAFRNHSSRVLSAQADLEQIEFLTTKSKRWFDMALTLGCELATKGRGDTSRSAAEHSAEWLANGKAIIGDVLKERYRRVETASVAGLGARQLQDLQDLKQVRRQLVQLAASIATDEELKKRAGEQDKLNAREITLSRRLSQVLAGRKRQAPWFTLQEIRNQLPADSVLIQVARFNQAIFAAKTSTIPFGKAKYAAWIVPPLKKGDVRVIDLGDAQDIDAAVTEFRNEIAHVQRKDVVLGHREANKRMNAKLGAVGKLVLAPISNHIKDFKHWVISPDGKLWMIPWHALPYENAFAVEKHNISYVFTARHLMATEGKAANKTAHIFADIDYQNQLPELPNSLQEGKAAKRLLERVGFQVEFRTLRTATKKELLAVRNPRILLLSTHGGFLGANNAPRFKNPLHSCRMFFAGNNSKESSLLASEILGLDLRDTQLVVLSACDTGLGFIRGSEGPESLPYAYQLAGARTVVSGLWELPDLDTALNIKTFFEYLQDGKDSVQALCQAQRDWIKVQRALSTRGNVANPRYWAGLTHIGPPGKIN